MHEIERKWKTLIETAPFITKDEIIKTERIMQYYIPSKLCEFRVRKVLDIDDNYFKYILTIKKGSGLKRKELEFNIPYKVFNFFKKISNKKLNKLRVTIKDNLEINFFDDIYDFVLIEKEFKTIKEANEYIPPKWVGLEVTNDCNYKNINLARRIK